MPNQNAKQHQDTRFSGLGSAILESQYQDLVADTFWGRFATKTWSSKSSLKSVFYPQGLAPRKPASDAKMAAQPPWYMDFLRKKTLCQSVGAVLHVARRGRDTLLFDGFVCEPSFLYGTVVRNPGF